MQATGAAMRHRLVRLGLAAGVASFGTVSLSLLVGGALASAAEDTHPSLVGGVVEEFASDLDTVAPLTEPASDPHTVAPVTDAVSDVADPLLEPPEPVPIDEARAIPPAPTVAAGAIEETAPAGGGSTRTRWSRPT